MSLPETSDRPAARRPIEAGLVLAFCCVGVMFAFHPMILSGFAKCQTNPGDPRLVNYILEHEYQCMWGRYPHRRLWSPPIFHPLQDTAAFTENLLSMWPFYVPWRLAGLLPDTAFQLWTITVAVLNYAAGFLFLRRCLKLGALASCAGAWVFAFGCSRVAHVGHRQLLCHVYLIIAIWAIFKTFRTQERTGERKAVGIWIALFFAALTAQVYAGLYVAYFFLLALAVAGLWAMVMGRTRRALLSLLWRHLPTILAAGAASLACLWPLLTRYRAAARLLGPRPWEEVLSLLPTPACWLYMGTSNWLYGPLSGRGIYQGLSIPVEQAIGVGFLTLALACIGLAWWWRRPWVRVLVLVSLTLALLVTLLPGGNTAWEYVYLYVPMAQGIRAVVRIGMLMLIPAGLGVAFFVEGMANRGFLSRRRKLCAFAVLVLIAGAMLEQGATTPAYDKYAARAEVAEIARQIDPACQAFYYTASTGPIWKAQLDAMWAQFEVRKPTINGYSGGWPRDFDPLFDCIIRGPQDRQRIRAGLDHWIAVHGMQGQNVCWIRPSGQDITAPEQ